MSGFGVTHTCGRVGDPWCIACDPLGADAGAASLARSRIDPDGPEAHAAMASARSADPAICDLPPTRPRRVAAVHPADPMRLCEQQARDGFRTPKLTEFLLARIEEDGRQHTNDPDTRRRIDAECEAKRRIVAAVTELHELRDSGSWDRGLGERLAEYEHAVLPNLAAVYADHPDYNDEWRP